MASIRQPVHRLSSFSLEIVERAQKIKKKKPPGIYRPPPQEVGVGKGKNILLFFFRARCRTLDSLTRSPNNRRKKKERKTSVNKLSIRQGKTPMPQLSLAFFPCDGMSP